ncbi:MAG: GGDEF domain-containing protein [Arcobacteraceae bacterium]
MFSIQEIVKNIFQKSILRCYIVIILLIIVSCYFIGKKVQLPYFYDNIIKIAVYENKKIASHIYTHSKIEDIGIEINDELHMLKENFKLQKIRIFDGTRKVIATTGENEIGEINNEEYFVTNIEKNEPFFQHISQTKKLQKNDVLKIYYPLSKESYHLGAIEIQYDILYITQEFDKIINKIDFLYFIITTVIIFTFIFILYRFSISDLNRQKYEKEIEELNKTLQIKVQKRTFQLLQKNKELKKLANFDSLTGIYNRRYFLNFAEKYFEVAVRNKTSLYILSFDLDHFKVVNDTHGHAAGDDVLKEFTKITKEFMRNSDLFGRIGGEEFAACVQNIQDEGVVLLAQKICDAICDNTIMVGNTPVRITVSIGVAKLSNEKDIDELIAKSDKAMYEAKQTGRNKVVFYKEG